jgi:hypothetical protein
MNLQSEKRLLQIIVILGSLIPICAGLSGILKGVNVLGGHGADLDSHFRYLSGLLLAIGIGFLSCVPGIENKTQKLKLLVFIVMIGGVGRFIGIISQGFPGITMQAALVMELIVSPLLFLWQYHLASKFNCLKNN